MKVDREFIDWLGISSIPFAIIFTKADKIAETKVEQHAKKWLETLKDTWETLPPYFISSSEKKTGREEILEYIAAINKTL